MALISCEALAIGYEGRKVAENINFQVDRGQYLCIIGENGAGKSTLMKTVLGLQRPMGGSIALGDGLTRNEIGYIPQQSNAQKEFPAAVKEVVLSGCLNKQKVPAFYSGKDKALAEKNMSRMGILELQKRCYRELSGGQQQRVLMARALCAAEKIIFLDEPMAGLDTETKEELYKILRELNEAGMAIVMISHDIDDVKEQASHILEIKKAGISFKTKKEYMRELEECHCSCHQEHN